MKRTASEETVLFLFAFQDFAHDDALDDVAAVPSQLQAGNRCLRFGGGGFGRGEGSHLLIMAGIVAFACGGAHAALVDRIIMFGHGNCGLQNGGPIKGTFIRLGLGSRLKISLLRSVCTGALHGRSSAPGRLLLLLFCCLAGFCQKAGEAPDKDKDQNRCCVHRKDHQPFMFNAQCIMHNAQL